MLLSSLLLFIHLIFIPLALGLMTIKGKFQEINNIILAYPLGLNIYFALFYIPVIFAYFQNLPFDVFSSIFLTITLLAIVIGVICLKKGPPDHFVLQKRVRRRPSFYLIAGILIIMAQALILAITTYNDPDDSWFVSTSTTAIYSNTINQFDPATGYLLDQFDTRRGFAPFPIFIAFISKMTFLHPAIIAHTIFPLVLIPASYIVYYFISLEFYKTSEKADQFIFVISLVNLFSGYSAKNSSIYLIGRIWQGKALLASLILPLLFLVLLWHKQKPATKTLLLAFIVIVSSILSSTTSIYLGPLLISAFMLSCMISEKSLKPMLLYTPLIIPYAVVALLSYWVK